MNLQQTIIDKLNQKKVLVAASGGSDSMALVHILFSNDVDIIVCYINHLQRPKEIEQELALLNSYCSVRDIPFFTLEIDMTRYQKTMNKQSFFRSERYRLLQNLAKQENYDYIATAHHQDDQVETLLMRTVKNYDVPSLQGIRENGLINDVSLIRPLLNTSKHEIIEYLKKENIQYCEDSSNASDDYFRNRIRHHVIPLFHEENNEFSKHFIERINDNIALYKYTYQNMKQLLNAKNIFDIDMKTVSLEPLYDVLIEHDYTLQKIIIEIVLKEFLNSPIKISQNQYKEILSLVLNKVEKESVTLSDEWYLDIQYQKLYLKPKQQLETKLLKKQKLVYGVNNYYDLSFKCVIEEPDAYLLKIDKNIFEQGLYLKMPHKDDLFQLQKGTKKLNRLYIDEKVIPLHRYNKPIIVTMNENVVYDFTTNKIGYPFLSKNVKNITPEWVYIQKNDALKSRF